jgi:2-keto-4-pentenoate hydratase/2-oxohepta-3-ene-1,7-dioic acid hydratase in catechol pathway
MAITREKRDMRLASYNLRGRPSFGAVAGAGAGEGIVDLRGRLSRFTTLVEVFRAQALDEAKAAAAGVRPDVPLSEVELLPPLTAPEKILCIGVNYANRGADYNVTNNPKYPSMFYRAPNSMVGSGQHLVRPKISEQLDYEGEIAIVIGKDCKHVAKERALEFIAGITLANEGTIRDWTRHGQFNVTQGKNFDATGGIGPWIVTDVDLTKPLQLVTRKNGELIQEDTTTSMIFSFADIIAYTTSFMTLKAGDVICTGTPTKKGPKVDPPVWLKPGDTIEVECPEIGVLSNSVVDEA